MRGLEPSWGISVLGETPTLFAWGLESPENEAGNGQTGAESRPCCKLASSTWLLWTRAAFQPFTGAEHGSGPQRLSRADQLG